MNQGISNSKARGLSLIEMMIAITLGILLTAGMIQLFQGTKQTFVTNDSLARIQENGRFTIELLKRELREAGSTGFCATQGPINNHLRQDCGGGLSALFGTTDTIMGWNFNGTGSGEDYDIPTPLDPSTAAAGDWSSSLAGSGSLPAPLVGQVVPGSDVLIVRRTRPIEG
ncbi:MAG: prepilin-type N-terminal cleavage/methylation domain-containing protein, partial [Wenzhouxiangellaceae bacterium]|nr:prepilin-type N-terminal cleavage/methylation domain-containing protein [Wenzhouxiangellaceae bacterium]